MYNYLTLKLLSIFYATSNNSYSTGVIKSKPPRLCASWIASQHANPALQPPPIRYHQSAYSYLTNECGSYAGGLGFDRDLSNQYSPRINWKIADCRT